MKNKKVNGKCILLVFVMVLSIILAIIPQIKTNTVKASAETAGFTQPPEIVTPNVACGETDAVTYIESLLAANGTSVVKN